MLFRYLALLAAFILFIPSGQTACLDDFTDALSEYKYKKPRTSIADGTPILTTNKYIQAMENKPRWKRFIDEVKQYRKNYITELKEKNNAYKQAKEADPNIREVQTGYRRMQVDAYKQQGHSIEEAFDKFNPGHDYVFKKEGTAKVVLSPANKVEGQTYVEIVYDIGGNYFRMQKGIYRAANGELEFINKQNRYIDWSGEIMRTSGSEIKQNPQLLRTRMDQSHFNALP